MTDATTATTTVPMIDPGSLSITDDFEAAIAAEAEKRGGVRPAATVDLHEQGHTGLGTRVRRWTWEEFDEEAVPDLCRPGRYVLVLRFAGIRGTIRQRVVVFRAEDLPKRPEPAPAALQGPTPPPPPATYGPEMILSMMLQVMQQQAAQAQNAAQQHQEMNQLLLAKLLDTANAPREKNVIQQMLEVDELIERRAAKRGGEDGLGMEAVAPLLAALVDGINTAKAQDTRRAPSSPPPARPAMPPAAQPKAAPLDSTESMLLRVADLLAAGSRQDEPDADAYAAVILDYMEAAGFEPADVLGSLPPDGLAAALCSKFPQLPEAFVVSVERAMREMVPLDAPEPEKEPATPPAETPAPKQRSRKDAAKQK